MTKDKLLWGKPEVTLDEAVEFMGCKLEDLIYLAATDELDIYILANDWNTTCIQQKDRSWRYSEWLNSFTGPLAPPNADQKKESARQIEGLLNSCGQDVTDGGCTSYGRRGVYGHFYLVTWHGYQPIAAETFREYREGAVSPVYLNFNRILKRSDSTIDRYLCTDPEVILQDALKDSKLFVMKVDLLKLLSQESADTNDAIDDKPLSTRERNTFLHIIRALGKIAELPVEPYAAADLILTELTDEHGNSPVSQRTIADKLSESRSIR